MLFQVLTTAALIAAAAALPLPNPGPGLVLDNPCIDELTWSPAASFQIDPALSPLAQYRFQDFNVISFGDFKAYHGDIEGRLLAAGDVMIDPDGFSIGMELKTALSYCIDSKKPWSLVMGGDSLCWSHGSLFPDGKGVPHDSDAEGIFAPRELTVSDCLPIHLVQRQTGHCAGNDDCLVPALQEMYAYYTSLVATWADDALTNSKFMVEYNVGLVIRALDMNDPTVYVHIPKGVWNSVTYQRLENFRKDQNVIVIIEEDPADCSPVMFGRGSEFPFDPRRVAFVFPAPTSPTCKFRKIIVDGSVHGSIIAPYHTYDQIQGVTVGFIVVEHVEKLHQANKLDCPPCPTPCGGGCCRTDLGFVCCDGKSCCKELPGLPGNESCCGDLCSCSVNVLDNKCCGDADTPDPADKKCCEPDNCCDDDLCCDDGCCNGKCCHGNSCCGAAGSENCCPTTDACCGLGCGCTGGDACCAGGTGPADDACCTPDKCCGGDGCCSATEDCCSTGGGTPLQCCDAASTDCCPLAAANEQCCEKGKCCTGLNALNETVQDCCADDEECCGGHCCKTGINNATNKYENKCCDGHCCALTGADQDTGGTCCNVVFNGVTSTVCPCGNDHCCSINQNDDTCCAADCCPTSPGSSTCCAGECCDYTAGNANDSQCCAAGESCCQTNTTAGNICCHTGNCCQDPDHPGENKCCAGACCESGGEHLCCNAGDKCCAASGQHLGYEPQCCPPGTDCCSIPAIGGVDAHWECLECYHLVEMHTSLHAARTELEAKERELAEMRAVVERLQRELALLKK